MEHLVMKKINNTKDKIVGEVKEAVGKATNNPQLEIKGKVQSSRADFRAKTEKIKEEMAHKINKIVDMK
jgi:uncharacterized protein YjbJ (UPF0337 family)